MDASMYVEHGERKRRIWSALIVLAIAASAVAVAVTGAIFTDSQSVGGNSLNSGSIDISTSPTSGVLTATAMAPGDRTNGTLAVTNGGTLQLRYAVQRSATNTDSKGLRDALRLRIGLQAGGSCDFPYYNTDGTTTTLSDDTALYEGLGFSGTATNTIGDVAQGAQSGDRTLNAAASETLCVSVVLPLAATGPQAAATTATFDFAAEQTANN
jgi:hypothetical protein